MITHSDDIEQCLSLFITQYTFCQRQKIVPLRGARESLTNHNPFFFPVLNPSYRYHINSAGTLRWI